LHTDPTEKALHGSNQVEPLLFPLIFCEWW
jgi:hypothetical protein